MSSVGSPFLARPAAALPEPLLASFDIAGLARYFAEKAPSRVLVMMGAGVSVAAGIPDFRSPGVGLYSRLAMRYPELAQRPERLFDLAAFRENPALFYRVMNEMGLWPDSYAPTAAHRFVRLLQDKGVLLRCYTQNIDTLERSAGIEEDLLVEAHGAFASAHCIDCGAAVPIEFVEQCAKADVVPLCRGLASGGSAGEDGEGTGCGGLVKPDVVFFGEAMPPRFFDLIHEDVEKCDLLLIIGTSLKVFPFALVPSFVPKSVPRVLINMTRAGDRSFVFQSDVDGTSPLPEESSSSSSSSSCSSSDAGDDDKKTNRTDGGDNADDEDGNDECEDQEECSDAASSSSSEGPNATPLPAAELLHCYRDLLLAGDCQQTILDLTAALGWELPPIAATAPSTSPARPAAETDAKAASGEMAN